MLLHICRVQKPLVILRHVTTRYYAHRSPLIAPLPKAPISEPKTKKPLSILEVLGKPSRRTRSALVIISVFIAFSLSNFRRESTAKSDEPFNPQAFSPFTLVSREPVSSTSSILTLRPEKAPKSSDPYSDLWKKGLWSLEFKQPQLQIARSYTPIPPLLNSEEEVISPNLELKFLIRHNGQGEVSNYLNGLPIGSAIELRGPRIEYQLPENIDEIIFLAGGTGIVPALQTLQTLGRRTSKEKSQMPKVKVLWANRRREDCLGGASTGQPQNLPGLSSRLFSFLRFLSKGDRAAIPSPAPTQASNAIVRTLSRLQAQSPEQLSVDYFVDEENTFINPATIKRYTGNSKAKNKEALGEHSEQRKKLILISGPDGFVEHFAGPKGWRLSVQVQGDLGGILGRMELDGWEVRKL